MSSPKILIWDLENAQTVAKTWGPKYQANLNKTVEWSNILMVGYRWLGEDETHVVTQRDFARDYKRNRRDDRQLVRHIAELIEEADIVVGQNSDKFDTRVLQARMFFHGMSRPMPTHSVDTVKVTRRQFKLTSYSLDDVARFVGIGGKRTHAGIQLWDDVEAGIEDAWDEMALYCERDVELTERLYLKLRDGGWIVNHPNMALLSGEVTACPTCGGGHLVRRGIRHATTRSYVQLRCEDCGSYCRETLVDKSMPKPLHRPI